MRSPSGAAGAQGTTEQRRLRMESEQLKLALAEAPPSGAAG
ncbi:hypothetical protein ACQPXH_00190 [Nocardia sp. CA-135953]